MMLLTLDNMAQRYSLLPTEVLARATTFDLYVTDVATRYARRQRDIADGKLVPTKNAGLTQEQMKAMLAAAKNAGPMKRKGATK